MTTPYITKDYFFNRYVTQPNAKLVFKSEWHFQKEVEKWRDFEQDDTPPLYMLRSVPNGQYRKGQRPEPCMRDGTPDVFMAFPYGGYHGLYIELKQKGKKPRDNQKREIRILRYLNYRVEVCYTLEQVMSVIADYLEGIELVYNMDELRRFMKELRRLDYED